MTLEVVRRRSRGIRPIDRQRVRPRVKITCAFVNKERRGSGHHGMSIEAGSLDPVAQRQNMIAVIEREAIGDEIVVAAKTSQPLHRIFDAAGGRISIEQDVIANDMAGPTSEIDRPAAVTRHHDGVVDDAIVFRLFGAVDAVEGDPARMIVVNQIVAKDGILNAVAIDSGAAASTVVVDHVAFDDGTGDDSVSPLADISVHVDAALPVGPRDIAKDQGAIATVADVDPVLFHGTRCLVSDD